MGEQGGGGNAIGGGGQAVEVLAYVSRVRDVGCEVDDATFTLADVESNPVSFSSFFFPISSVSFPGLEGLSAESENSFSLFPRHSSVSPSLPPSPPPSLPLQNKTRSAAPTPRPPN